MAESAKIKAKVVAKDETEAGLRMILNYGHTIGHAIETLTKYKAVNHGEAVGIGMVAAAKVANHLKMISQEVVARISGLLEKLGLPTEIDGLPAKRIIKALQIDKKVRAGKVQFVLPEKIGKVVIKSNVSLKVIKAVLMEMGCR